MKRIPIPHGIAAIAFLSLLACSEFYPSFVSYGEPVRAAGDTIRDTVNIPWDSILLDTTLPVNDTLLTGNFVFRLQRSVQIDFRIRDTLGIDSVLLYGALVAGDTLQLQLRAGSGLYQDVAEVEIDSAAGRVSHALQQTLRTGLLYSLRWDNRLDSLDVSALLLIGYDRGDSASLHLPRNLMVAEMQLIAQRQVVLMEREQIIAEFRVLPGDTLRGHLEGIGVRGAIITQEQLDEVLFTGEFSGDALWEGGAGNWTLAAREQSTWVYLLSNPTDLPVAAQDSLVVVRRF